MLVLFMLLLLCDFMLINLLEEVVRALLCLCVVS